MSSKRLMSAHECFTQEEELVLIEDLKSLIDAHDQHKISSAEVARRIRRRCLQLAEDLKIQNLPVLFIEDRELIAELKQILEL